MITSGQHPMKDEKSRYILNWIKEISKIRPELGNFSIQEQKLHQIVPNSDFDVIINIVEDEIDANYLYESVDNYNRDYPDYKFIADHGKTNTYIQGIQTNNGKYNLVLCQSRNELTEAREKIAKTNYYDYWDKNYLEEVLEDDYRIINDEKTR